VKITLFGSCGHPPSLLLAAASSVGDPVPNPLKYPGKAQRCGSSASPREFASCDLSLENARQVDQDACCGIFPQYQTKLLPPPLTTAALKRSSNPVDWRYACGIRGSESLLQMLAVTGRSARRRSELHSRATTAIGGRYGIPNA
jgi:hypothetical protein